MTNVLGLKPTLNDVERTMASWEYRGNLVGFFLSFSGKAKNLTHFQFTFIIGSSHINFRFHRATDLNNLSFKKKTSRAFEWYRKWKAL